MAKRKQQRKAKPRTLQAKAERLLGKGCGRVENMPLHIQAMIRKA